MGKTVAYNWRPIDVAFWRDVRIVAIKDGVSIKSMIDTLMQKHIKDRKKALGM